MSLVKRNCIFSIVGPSRTLDLEAESEAARHQWMRAFSAFVKRAASYDVSAMHGPKLTSGLLGPTMDVASALGVGKRVCLGDDNVRALDEALDAADAVFSQLAASEKVGDISAPHRTVDFPRIASTLSVLTGCRPGRWSLWSSSCPKACSPLGTAAYRCVTSQPSDLRSTSNRHPRNGARGRTYGRSPPAASPDPRSRSQRRSRWRSRRGARRGTGRGGGR